jgi:single-strand DNA-binding protein
MYTNNLQLIGNLVDAPTVQVTPSGVVRARFRLASTERRRDATTETWQDGESVFIDVTCWRRLAQNVGNSLAKGDRVVVIGRLRQWIAERDGIRRAVHEIEADVVAVDLQRGMATIARPRRPEATDSDGADAAAAGVDPETGEIETSQVGTAVGAAGLRGPDLDEGMSLGASSFEAPVGADPLETEFDARPLTDAGV